MSAIGTFSISELAGDSTDDEMVIQHLVMMCHMFLPQWELCFGAGHHHWHTSSSYLRRSSSSSSWKTRRNLGKLRYQISVEGVLHASIVAVVCTAARVQQVGAQAQQRAWVG